MEKLTYEYGRKKVIFHKDNDGKLHANFTIPDTGAYEGHEEGRLIFELIEFLKEFNLPVSYSFGRVRWLKRIHDVFLKGILCVGLPFMTVQILYPRHYIVYTCIFVLNVILVTLL